MPLLFTALTNNIWTCKNEDDIISQQFLHGFKNEDFHMINTVIYLRELVFHFSPSKRWRWRMPTFLKKKKTYTYTYIIKNRKSILVLQWC